MTCLKGALQGYRLAQWTDSDKQNGRGERIEGDSTGQGGIRTLETGVDPAVSSGHRNNGGERFRR